MVRIEGTPREISYGRGGELQHVVDLQVSTIAELPDKGDVVGGGKLMPGSIAQIIQTGQWATLDEDGKWYADGEEVGTEQASTLNSAALTLGKSPTLAVIEPESSEPDELEHEQTEAEPQEVTEDAELL